MFKLFIRFEYIYSVLALLLYSGGFLTVVLVGGHSEGVPGNPPDPNLKPLFFLTYLISACLLAIRWKTFVYVLTKDLFIFPLVGLALLSVLWSFSPNDTLIRTIALIGSTLFGVYLATRYTLKQQVLLLGSTFGLILLFSFVYAILLPKYGLEHGIHAGAWRGVFAHKNHLGGFMILSSAVFCSLISTFKQYRLLAGVGLAATIVLSVLSQSTTSLIGVLVILSTFFLCRSLNFPFHWKIVFFSVILILGCSASIWLTSNPDTFSTLTGKDLSSLSGRSGIWPLLYQKIAQRPWLGYGFQAFWNGWSSQAADIWYAERWMVPNAHNGFIELCLELGLSGLFLFIAGYVSYLTKFLVQFNRSIKPELILPILYFTFYVLTNLTESSLLNRNNIFWVIYVSLTISSIMPDKKSMSKSELPKKFINP